MTLRTLPDLYVLDRDGERDDRWNDSFGFARLVVEILGKRCLACGRKLWFPNGLRQYCDDTCKRRHSRRRDRYRAFLREAEQPCVYCGCDPANAHTMLTET